MILPLEPYQAEISQNLKLTPKVHKIVLELMEPKTLEFLAGQFLMYEVEVGIKRAYSMASPPSIKDKVELFINVSPGGPASQYFSSVKVGTRCNFMAPYGQFVLRENNNDMVFVAGGTGVAPIRSMILDYYSSNRQLAVRSSRPAKRGSNNNLSLYFGVNKVEELFLMEEFRNLEKEYPNFKFVPVVLQPEREWEGETGLVTGPLLRDIGGGGGSGGFAGKDFYVCGPPKMVEAVKQQLLDKGVRQENIFNERY